MTDVQYLSGGRLLEIIAAGHRTDAATTAATRVLELHRECSFRAGVVPKSDLLKIYRRRLASPILPPGAVLGSERMVDDFEANQGESFAAFSVQDAATIVDIWLTGSLDRLVTLSVGRDQRWTDDGQERPPRTGGGRR